PSIMTCSPAILAALYTSPLHRSFRGHSSLTSTLPGEPYTAVELTWTSLVTWRSRAARATFFVPTKVLLDRGLLASTALAQWTTIEHPSIALCTDRSSLTSPTTISTGRRQSRTERRGSRTKARTLASYRAERNSTRRLPKKPLAPVTKI